MADVETKQCFTQLYLTVV